jgi:hypothetical protein
LSGRENHVQQSSPVRTLSDYPVGVPLLMGTDDVRVAGAATTNYLHTIMPTGAIAFFGMRSAMTNRRNPDFALTSTPPTCEPEVIVQTSTMHRICRSHTGTWRPVAGGTERQRAIHWIDAQSRRCPMTNTLPRTGCFSRNASADKFRGGNDAGARKRSLRSPSKGPFSLHVTRRSDFAALRRGADGS